MATTGKRRAVNCCSMATRKLKARTISGWRAIDHCTDHSHGIWGYDDKGSEYFTLRVRNLATGEDLADVIENSGGGGTWGADGKSFFYTLQDDNHRPPRCSTTSSARPRARTGWSMRKTDPGFFMGVGGSLLGRLYLHRYP